MRDGTKPYVLCVGRSENIKVTLHVYTIYYETLLINLYSDVTSRSYKVNKADVAVI